jgi:hypothetical protein
MGGWITLRQVGRSRSVFFSQPLIVLAGIALILAGILCLGLSGAVVQGWWQGTLDAFGVGFIVAGLVDVLAISGLSQVIAAQQRRWELNSEAVAILRSGMVDLPTAIAAKKLLDRSEGQIARMYSDMLQALIDRVQRKINPGDLDIPPAGKPGHGDTPKAPEAV